MVDLIPMDEFNDSLRMPFDCAEDKSTAGPSQAIVLWTGYQV